MSNDVDVCCLLTHCGINTSLIYIKRVYFKPMAAMSLCDVCDASLTHPNSPTCTTCGVWLITCRVLRNCIGLDTRDKKGNGPKKCSELGAAALHNKIQELSVVRFFQFIWYVFTTVIHLFFVPVSSKALL